MSLAYSCHNPLRFPVMPFLFPAAARLTSWHGKPPHNTSTGGKSAPRSSRISSYMGMPGQCRRSTERQKGSTSQKKACPIPAHSKPRSHNPTPEKRLPTCKRLLRMAVSRLGAGARGPHVIDCPASGAFDAQIKGRPFGQHLVAVSAPDFVVVCSLHFLIVLPLRPRIRPDMRLRARHEHNRRRILRMICPYHVGPWFGGKTPSRWGSLRLPRHCLKSVFFCPSSELEKSPGAAFTARRRWSNRVCW